MNWKQPKAYAVQHKDDATRAASRSGGIFTAISDYVLEQGGVVYGCILTDEFKAIHIRADSQELRNKMRGSKYIQSKMGESYRNVKADLVEGRKVLFSGTSCQIAGLKNYLRNEYDGLICIDIVCHGVPSPKVWGKYLDWQEKRSGKRITAVDFRNKKDFGWHSHIETLTFDDGTQVSSDIFKNLFYGHMILRPSCYKCPYKSVMHPGDITIADYWGIEKAAKEFDDNKGVSLVLVNNKLGESVFDSVKKSVKWKETRLEDSMQPPLKAPFPEPVGRTDFWNNQANRNFDYIAKKYGGAGLTNKIKRGLRKIKRKLVG